MMRAVLAVMGKELRDILRERSIVAALVVQFFIAAFSAFLSVGLLGLYDPSSIDATTRAEVVYAGPGDFADAMEGERNLRVGRETAERALEVYRSGGATAFVEETVETTGVRVITVLVPEGTIEGTLLLTQLRGLLDGYEHELRVQHQDQLGQAVVAVEAPGTSSSFGFAYGTLLPLLLLTPVFLSGAIAGDSFVHEVQTRSLLVLRSAPAPLWAILAGKVGLPVLLAPVQAALWLALLAANGAPASNLWALLLLASALALLFGALSVALAARLRRQGPVQAAYAVIVLVLAASGLLLPHDPLNLIALLGSGAPPATVWATLAALVVASFAVAALALPYAARVVRSDRA
jgi:ABC-2 type transport system permease protein